MSGQYLPTTIACRQLEGACVGASDQFWGANTETNDSWVGKPRQITVDTEEWSLRLHDGITPGGRKLPSLSGLAGLLVKLFDDEGAVDGALKVWSGLATTDSDGLWAVDYSDVGFSTILGAWPTTVSAESLVVDRPWAALNSAPALTGCAGYALRGSVVVLGGTGVRTAPGVQVSVLALGV